MDNNTLRYSHFERLPVPAPVDRLAYIAERCRGKRILDLGCLDETALIKRDTQHWLHGRIATVATEVLGIDLSSNLPSDGMRTAANARIIRADASDPTPATTGGFSPDVIVAGEFIEHIPSPLAFLESIKRHYAGKSLVLSTPNGCSLSNCLLGVLRREVQHPDHLHVFTFKTLNTLCMRAGFTSWSIIPYRFFATEMILRSRPPLRQAAIAAEKTIRGLERVMPALGFGYIIDIHV